MNRGSDGETGLLRALIGQAATCGLAIDILRSDWTRWASATFAGARHIVTLTAADSSALDIWLADLPEAEFFLPGHLVADLAVQHIERTGGRVTATIEILTVEER